MKKLIIILFVLLFIPLIFAECPPDCKDVESRDLALILEKIQVLLNF